jgi:hypothetical protein
MSLNFFRSQGTTRIALEGFSRDFTFVYFSKLCRESSVYIEIFLRGIKYFFKYLFFKVEPTDRSLKFVLCVIISTYVRC